MSRKRQTHWALTFLNGTSSLLNFFLPLFMSRQMTPSEVGDFKLFFLYLGIVPALSLGVGFANGVYQWGADPGRGQAKVRAAVKLACVAGGLASGAALAIGFGFGAGIHSWLFAFCCLPIVAGTIYEGSLVAAGEVRRAAWFATSFELVRLGGMLAAIKFGFGLLGVLWVHAVVSWVKLGVGVMALRPLDAPAGELGREQGGLLHYAFPVSLAAAFDLLVQNADRYILAALLAAPEFAVYSFGCLMIPPLFIFEQSVNQVLIPKLANEKIGDRNVLAHYRAAVEELLLILIPCSAWLMVAAKPLVRMLFTDAYSDAAQYLVLFAPYYALLGLPQDVLARARGNSGWILRTSVVAGLAALALSGLGAFLFGAKGALAGFLVVQLGRRAYATVYSAHAERAKVADIFPFRSAAIFLFSAALAAAAAFWAREIHGSAFFICLCSGFIFSLCYGLQALLFFRRPFFRLLRSWRRR